MDWMSDEQLNSLTLDELRALYLTFRKKAREARPCTWDFSEALATAKQIAAVMKAKEARMEQLLPSVTKNAGPKPGH